MLHTVAAYTASFYRDGKGRSEVLIYFRRMNKKHRAKAAKWIKLLEIDGPGLLPYADVLDSPVRELRPKMAGLQHRFLFMSSTERRSFSPTDSLRSRIRFR